VQTILPVVQLPGAEPGRCTLQRAGHNVNPVQARVASERPGIAGTLVRTDAGVVLRPADGGDDLVLRCHRPEALDEVLARFGPDGWRVSTSLLLNDRGVGISVACGDTELSPCATG
jgi:hypothetical protein